MPDPILARQRAAAEQARQEHEKALDAQRDRDRLVKAGNLVQDFGSAFEQELKTDKEYLTQWANLMAGYRRVLGELERKAEKLERADREHGERWANVVLVKRGVFDRLEHPPVGVVGDEDAWQKAVAIFQAAGTDPARSVEMLTQLATDPDLGGFAMCVARCLRRDIRTVAEWIEPRQLPADRLQEQAPDLATKEGPAEKAEAGAARGWSGTQQDEGTGADPAHQQNTPPASASDPPKAEAGEQPGAPTAKCCQIVDIPESFIEMREWLRERVGWLRASLMTPGPESMAPGFVEEIVALFGKSPSEVKLPEQWHLLVPEDPAHRRVWAHERIYLWMLTTIHRIHGWLERHDISGQPDWAEEDPEKNPRAAIRGLEHLSALLNFVGKILPGKTEHVDGRRAEASGTTISPTDLALRALPDAGEELFECLTHCRFRHLASEEWSRLEALDRQVSGLAQVAGLTSMLPPRGLGTWGETGIPVMLSPRTELWCGTTLPPEPPLRAGGQDYNSLEILPYLKPAPDGKWSRAMTALLENAKRMADAPTELVSPGTASGGQPRSGRKEKRRVPSVNPKIKARDKWIYRKCCKGVAHDEIVAQLKRIGPTRGWPIISTKQRIQQIGKEYAEKNGLPPPPSRRNQ